MTRTSHILGVCLSAGSLLAPLSAGAQALGSLRPRIGILATHSLQADGLGTDFGVSLGIGSRVGRKSRIGIEAGYLRLGSQDEVRPYLTPPPALEPATLTTNASRRLLFFGANLEQGLGSRGVRPVLLAGLGAYGFRANYSAIGRDTTGGVFLRRKEGGWHWGPGVSAGLGLAFPGSVGPFAPAFEGRVHVSAIKTEESWTTLETLSVGISLGW